MKKYLVKFYLDQIVKNQQLEFHHKFEAVDMDTAENMVINGLENFEFMQDNIVEGGPHSYWFKSSRVVNFTITDMGENK